MSAFQVNLRYAMRRLAAAPAFTAAVALTLAAGIGGNVAIFSVIRAVLIRPLPFPQPDRLMALWQADSKRSIQRERITPANLADWRAQNQVFEDIAFWPAWPDAHRLNIAGRDGNRQLWGTTVTASFFRILRIQPVLGRTFSSEEDQAGAPLVAVLSYTLWRDEFGADPQVVGKTVTIDSYGRRRYTVVGVMPMGFRFPVSTELWLNTSWMGGIRVPPPGAAERCCSWFESIARLKPNISIGQARTDMNRIASGISRQHPASSFGPEVEVIPLADEIAGSARMQLLLLAAAAGCVLLIACANVANLLLARAAGRRKEIAIRLSLGASRGELVRQVLTESVFLSIIGGAAGMLFATWGTSILKSQMPRSEEVHLDGLVFFFGVMLSLATGILTGLIPAWQASKENVSGILKDAGTSPLPVHGRVLVLVESALTLALLAGAGLLLRSFENLNRVNTGFDSANVLTMALDMTSSVFGDRESSRALFHDLMERIQAMPGVRAVGGVTEIPMTGTGAGQPISLEGQPLRSAADSPTARTLGATASYFPAMGVPLLKGRFFTEADRTGAPTAIVINETMARRYWPELRLEQVVGKRIMLGSRDRYARQSGGQPAWMDIVGITGDMRTMGPQAEIAPELYMSYRQWPWYDVHLVVRSAGDPLALAGAIQAELRRMNKSVIVSKIRTMEQVRSDSIAQPSLRARLVGIFAAIALLLAAIGIQGVVSYTVTQRTREIGIRMAVGARSADVMKLVIRQGLIPVFLGLMLGMGAFLAGSSLMKRFLFGLGATDPATLGAAAAILAGIAVTAMWIPARRATGIDPTVALRHE